jgi:hypothetical protein
VGNGNLEKANMAKQRVREDEAGEIGSVQVMMVPVRVLLSLEATVIDTVWY